MGCRNNQITQQAGTFIEINTEFHEAGSFQFEETHECYKDHSVYKFLNTKESFHR